MQEETSWDLVVLTADSHQKAVVETLLEHRHADLGIRRIDFEVYPHPQSDPGVWKRAAEFLRPFLRTHGHALVVLDSAWKGAPPAKRIASEVADSLSRNGWDKRSAVIVIEPELEAWCWIPYEPATEEVLGVPWDDLRNMGEETGYWKSGSPKPTAPKELMDAALRRSRTPRSARLYSELALRLPFATCVDPAFTSFRQNLNEWFPAE